MVLVWACLLKYGPFRDSLQATVNDLSGEERLALRTGDVRIMYTVLTRTCVSSSGADTSAWHRSCNRGRVARQHGCGFAQRIGLLLPWRDGGEARGVLTLDGARYTSAPLAGALTHHLASLAPLQTSLKVFLACPPRA